MCQVFSTQIHLLNKSAGLLRKISFLAYVYYYYHNDIITIQSYTLFALYFSKMFKDILNVEQCII